jgi:uncharacterized protein (TIGR02001 family)
MKQGYTASVIAAAMASTFCSPAYAEKSADAQVNAFDLSTTISVVSDYRFRGISLSNKKPAVQASVDVSHKSGVYASVWGSTISNYGGANFEVDAALGWKNTVGPVTLDLGGTAYLYPGGTAVNAFETYAYVGKTIGPAQLRAGIVYAPKQKNLGGADNIYFTADARVGVPKTPFTVTASVGHEHGAFAGPTGNKWDWSFGAEYTRAPFTLGFSYVDTNIADVDDPSHVAKAGIIASASADF